MARVLRATAAWRICTWTTLAFALGTALAFFVLYLLVAKSIRDRSDAWLSGEVETLAQVSASTPPDRLYRRIVGEVAELATREMPDERNARGQRRNSVFFLEEDLDNNEPPLWVGPTPNDAFLRAIHATNFPPGAAQSLKVEGWPTTFRLVKRQDSGRTTYLGLSTSGDLHLLNSFTRRFLLLWSGTVLLGFLISYLSVHRTLRRVERITETVERIGENDLGERLPEPPNSDEISRLSETFNRMLDRIQSSVTELRLVTDALAHDLRSPITAIRGNLESTLASDPSEKWRDAVCEAIEGLDRLLNVLDTTLDVTEAQAGALRLDRGPVDLSSVVRQLIDLYQPAMAERRHAMTLEIQSQVIVDADEQLLHRVVSNLLDNELAHLPPGCQVSLRLRSRERFAELTIEDNGPGFPTEISRRAFERFVKGEHSAGHGLGLAFVGAVAHAHGGAVNISARPSGGAVITLSLPAFALQAA